MDDKELSTGAVQYDKGAGNDPQLPDISSAPEKKKSLGEKIAGFLASDDFNILSKSIYERKIAPVLQRLAVDIFAEIIYHGKPHNDNNIFSSGPYTDYQMYSGSSKGSESQNISRFRFREIYYRTAEDAERVLSVLNSMIRQKGFVTVADYYNVARQTPEYTYYNYGWDRLDGASVYGYNNSRNERIYGIRFPSVKPMHNRQEP